MVTHALESSKDDNNRFKLISYYGLMKLEDILIVLIRKLKTELEVYIII